MKKQKRKERIIQPSSRQVAAFLLARGWHFQSEMLSSRSFIKSGEKTLWAPREGIFRAYEDDLASFMDKLGDLTSTPVGVLRAEMLACDPVEQSKFSPVYVQVETTTAQNVRRPRVGQVINLLLSQGAPWVHKLTKGGLHKVSGPGGRTVTFSSDSHDLPSDKQINQAQHISWPSVLPDVVKGAFNQPIEISSPEL